MLFFNVSWSFFEYTREKTIKNDPKVSINMSLENDHINGFIDIRINTRGREIVNLYLDISLRTKLKVNAQISTCKNIKIDACKFPPKVNIDKN